MHPGYEYDPGSILGPDGDETVRGLVEIGKPAFVLDPLESSVYPIGPPMVRADKLPRAARAARDLSASMAAGIAKCANRPVFSSHGKDGNPGRDSRYVGAGLAERGGGTEGYGESAQKSDLAVETLLAAIVIDRLAPHLVAQVGRTVTYVR